MASRGGRRQGRPGKAYSNRTDLSTDYMPSTAQMTPASGPPPYSGGGASNVGQQPVVPHLTPEDVPSLTDPTTRPDEPADFGLGQSFAMPAPHYVNMLHGAYMANPTPELKRAIDLLVSKGVD